jgi:hypothetical protein
MIFLSSMVPDHPDDEGEVVQDCYPSVQKPSFILCRVTPIVRIYLQ